MYLSDIYLENTGPIESADFRLAFDQENRPKPAILVGANGSGKTILLATITDALTLMSAPHFSDVVPQMGLGHAYFKILGGSNQRVKSSHSLALLGFRHASTQASYVEKTGKLNQSQIPSAIKARFAGATWSETGDVKTFTGFDESSIKSICRVSALCFFPSSRRELPHWLNVDAIGENPDKEPSLDEASRFSNILGKPLFVERCREQNKRWILNVLFDSRTELIRDGEAVKTAPYDNINDRLLLTVAKNNIDKILKVVLGDEEVRIHANYRSRGPRLAIARGKEIIIPSLDNLSLGQSLLFNLFCTIARYADTYDLSKGHQLDQIDGIVIVDEIDAHLHTDLQFSSLPKLIKLFPRVQFVISTHSPMFLLGMEKEFGAENVSIFEMPTGDPISTERFSEFKKSFDYYRETVAFEQALKDGILSSTKPTVLFEGDTDRDYVVHYLKLLGREDLIEGLQIDWVGRNENGIAKGGGKDALNAVEKVFRAKLPLLRTKLLLVHDCDCNKRSEIIDQKLHIQGIPENPTNKRIRRGIENLLPDSVVQSQFYDEQTDDKGNEHRILNKRRLCDWIVSQNDLSYFPNFTPLLKILDDFARGD